MHLIVGVFRLLVAAIGIVGVREIWLGDDLPGLVYFTNQSNLLLVVVMAWAGVGSLRAAARRGAPPASSSPLDGPPAWLKGAATLFILIAGLVYAVILAPGDPQPELVLGLTDSDLVHVVTPIAALADFVLVDPHRRLRLRLALAWLAYPLAYCLFTTVRGALAPELGYPYDFVDVAEHGYAGLLVNVAVYGIGFWVLGAVIIGLDRVLPARPLLAPPRSVSPPGSAVTPGSGQDDPLRGDVRGTRA